MLNPFPDPTLGRHQWGRGFLTRRGGGEWPPRSENSHQDLESETGLLVGQHQQEGHGITHTDLHRDAEMGGHPCPPQPPGDGSSGSVFGAPGLVPRQDGEETCTRVLPRVLGQEGERRRRRMGCTSVLQDGLVGLVHVLGHLGRSAFQGQLWGERRRGGSCHLVLHREATSPKAQSPACCNIPLHGAGVAPAP